LRFAAARRQLCANQPPAMASCTVTNA
jgi:hypothetical protein